MSNSTVPPTRPLEPQPKAIVVGSSSGIGAALAKILAERGYYVALVARRENRLRALSEDINSDVGDAARTCYYTHDVTDYGSVPSLFQEITNALGGLDLVVYSAGVQPSMSSSEYNFEKDKLMVDVNIIGAMAWLGQAAARFEKAGEGHIVGISSIAGDRGRRLNPGYNTSKAALDTYLEALRNRLARYGVAVTTIKPGFVDTALLDNAPRTMWVLSPEEAAVKIYKAISHRKQTAYVPGRWRFVALIIKYMPSVIFRRLNI
jgi:short-subunit dehydrogenase